MNACITRETIVLKVFWRVFHSNLKLKLCRHACRRSDPIYFDVSIWKKHADHSTSLVLVSSCRYTINGCVNIAVFCSCDCMKFILLNNSDLSTNNMPDECASICLGLPIPKYMLLRNIMFKLCILLKYPLKIICDQ